jgi:nucleoside-diphosphate kinase
MARAQRENPHVLAIKRQRTLILIKPDGVQRGLVGDIVHRFERAGLKLVGLKMVWPSTALVEKHYPKDRAYLISIGEKATKGMEKLGLPVGKTPLEIGTWVRAQLGRYLAIGPVVAMVWQGTNAIANVRQLVGSTDPILADVGSIRGDLTIDTIEMANCEDRSVRNLIHASSDADEAKREIALWFTDAELYEYENVMDKVLHDAEWDRPKEK